MPYALVYPSVMAHILEVRQPLGDKRSGPSPPSSGAFTRRRPLRSGREPSPLGDDDLQDGEAHTKGGQEPERTSHLFRHLFIILTQVAPLAGINSHSLGEDLHLGDSSMHPALRRHPRLLHSYSNLPLGETERSHP